MRAGTVIGFPGVAHPLTVTHDVGGPSGVNIHGVQLAGGVRSNGDVAVSGSIVQGYVSSPGSILATGSLFEGSVWAQRGITFNDSTLHGDMHSGSSALLTRVLGCGNVHAQHLALVGSNIFGQAIITGTANVLGSSLISLNVRFCISLEGTTIRELLAVASDKDVLVVTDSKVGSIRFGSFDDVGAPNPTIVLCGNSFVDGLVHFIGKPGRLIVEPGARFTGNVTNGTVQRQRSGGSGI